MSKIVEQLKTNSTTAPIVNLVNSSRYTILDQLQVEGYEIDGHPFKSMLDKVIIDHQERVIKPFDLKCTWNVENFYEEYYLKRRSYIQALLYYAAIHKNREVLGFDATEYHVEPPKFIVCDSTNYFNPLLYTLDWPDLQDARDGFTHKGRTYPGVKDLISALRWCIQTDTWTISYKNYLSSGIINIKD